MYKNVCSNEACGRERDVFIVVVSPFHKDEKLDMGIFSKNRTQLIDIQ